LKIFQNKNRKKDLFLALVTSEKTHLYRIAFAYLRHEDDALDAVDEAIFLGLIHLRKLKKDEYMKTWLIRILINECKRILRDRKRLVVSKVVPDTPSPYQESDIALQMSVEALPEELKEIILLRYYGDLTVKDTAELLSIPQGTVASRTKKALSLLKEDLTKEEGGKLHENC